LASKVDKGTKRLGNPAQSSLNQGKVVTNDNKATKSDSDSWFHKVLLEPKRFFPRRTKKVEVTRTKTTTTQIAKNSSRAYGAEDHGKATVTKDRVVPNGGTRKDIAESTTLSIHEDTPLGNGNTAQSNIMTETYDTAQEDDQPTPRTYHRADSAHYDIIEVSFGGHTPVPAILPTTVSRKEHDDLLEQFEKLDKKHDTLLLKHSKAQDEYYDLLEKYESLTAYTHDLFASQVMEKYKNPMFGPNYAKLANEEDEEEEEEEEDEEKEGDDDDDEEEEEEGKDDEEEEDDDDDEEEDDESEDEEQEEGETEEEEEEDKEEEDKEEEDKQAEEERRRRVRFHIRCGLCCLFNMFILAIMELF